MRSVLFCRQIKSCCTQPWRLLVTFWSLKSFGPTKKSEVIYTTVGQCCNSILRIRKSHVKVYTWKTYHSVQMKWLKHCVLTGFIFLVSALLWLTVNLTAPTWEDRHEKGSVAAEQHSVSLMLRIAGLKHVSHSDSGPFESNENVSKKPHDIFLWSEPCGQIPNIGGKREAQSHALQRRKVHTCMKV